MDVLCDWVEASILFDDGRLSMSDVSDILMENNVYSDQDFAAERLESVWETIRRRQNWIGVSRLLQVQPRSIERVVEWRDAPAHAFCIAVALREMYQGFSDYIGDNYMEQGSLFERVTAEALTAWGWSTYITGWSGLGNTLAFQNAITDIGDRLHESANTVGLPHAAKDHGLDVVCYYPFTDGRGGYPAFLIQCASGRHWERKLRTPSLSWWESRISFSLKPGRGIAVPYAFTSDADFREHRLNEEGIFFDRHRLLSAGSTRRDWMTAELRTDLIEWLSRYVDYLTTLRIDP
jgi:hypothetical protein